MNARHSGTLHLKNVELFGKIATEDVALAIKRNVYLRSDIIDEFDKVTARSFEFLHLVSFLGRSENFEQQ